MFLNLETFFVGPRKVEALLGLMMWEEIVCHVV